MKRSLLRGLIALTATGIAAAAAPPPGPLPPAADQSLAREIFKELIAINTTHAVGSTDAARAIERRLLSQGFTAQEVQVIAPAAHPSKGNLVIRYRGRSPASPLLFLGHLDVVDARAEDWSVPPFELTEKDGWFYGRGAIDMKDGIAAMVATLIRLRREHFVPQRDLIFALTADEEAGGDANGPEFLLREHRELINAPLAINLDGGGGNFREGQREFLELGTSEKTYLTFTLQTTSPGGHGSLPTPDNAIYHLARGLGRIEALQFPVRLTATTRANFMSLASLDPGPLSADLRAVAATPSDSSAAQRLSQNVRLNAQLRTTCVATLIAGGHAENALPQRARSTVQCRMMPGDSAAAVQQALVAALDDSAIEVTLDAPPIVSPESVPTPQITKFLATVAHSMWPGVPIVPSMATGFSDGRQTRNAGIPTYDMSGIWMDVDENRAHGRDERVGVRAFDESVEYTYRLVKAASALRP